MDAAALFKHSKNVRRGAANGFGVSGTFLLFGIILVTVWGMLLGHNVFKRIPAPAPAPAPAAPTAVKGMRVEMKDVLADVKKLAALQQALMLGALISFGISLLSFCVTTGILGTSHYDPQVISESL